MLGEIHRLSPNPHYSCPVYSPRNPYSDSSSYARHISHLFPMFWTHASWKSLSSNNCGLFSLIALKARFPIASTLSLCLKPPSPFPHNLASLILVFSSSTTSGEYDYKLRRNTAYSIKLTQPYQLHFSVARLYKLVYAATAPAHQVVDLLYLTRLPS